MSNKRRYPNNKKQNKRSGNKKGDFDIPFVLGPDGARTAAGAIDKERAGISDDTRIVITTSGPIKNGKVQGGSVGVFPSKDKPDGTEGEVELVLFTNGLNPVMGITLHDPQEVSDGLRQIADQCEREDTPILMDLGGFPLLIARSQQLEALGVV